mgnify:CR=1 FL=1
MTTHLLCHNDDLPENKTRSFSVESQQGKIDLFVVKIDNKVYGYKNLCPHLGIPLNWQPDEFLSIEETHIQCATHGALFTMETGDCIAGPCSGDKLSSLNIEQRDNEVWLQL